MSFPAQLKYFLLTLLFSIATINFVRTTINIIQSSRRLEDLRVEVGEMETQKLVLEQELEYKNTSDYVEERARNALNFIKPGEKVYVAPRVLGQSTERSKSYEIPQKKTNLELWYELFL